MICAPPAPPVIHALILVVLQELLILLNDHIPMSQEKVHGQSGYTAGHPHVFVLNPEPWTIRSQYDLWPPPGNLIAWDALLLVPTGMPLHFMLTARFSNITSRGSLSVPMGTAGEHRFDLYRCTNLKSWP